MSRLHPVFNTIKLTPAPEDPIPGRHPHPPPLPEIVNGEEEWIVEAILDSKVINRKLRYLVKWEGFGIEHNSWEPWDGVHAPDLVADFHRTNPGAPRQIRSIEFNTIPFRPTSSLVVSGRHSIEGGVDVRGHLSQSTSPVRTIRPSAAIPAYVPPHKRNPYLVRTQSTDPTPYLPYLAPTLV